MKEIFKGAAKLFGKTLIANFLCFFIVISVSAIAVVAFSEVSGYYVTATKDEETVNYTHYVKDGEDTKLAEYEKLGYTVNKQSIKEVSEGGNIVSNIITQFFSFAVLVCLVYPYLWDRGYKERNLVQTGNMKSNPLKGLKIGLIASIPAYLFLIVSVITNFSVAIFKILNSAYFSLIDFIAEEPTGFSSLNAWQIVLIALCFLIMPMVSFIGYYLGYNDYSISERIIYKGKKKK